MKVFIHKLTCIDFAFILVTTDDATSQYDNFVKEIKGTLNSLFPPGSRTPKSKPMVEKRLFPSPWWTEKCQAAVDARREAKRL